MKKLIILLVVFFNVFVFSTKAESNMMFEKANQLYHNKMYDSAITLYTQMINDGFCSADLYYNAGNAYFRNNKIGMAVWCYKKALQIKDTKNYQDNLALAKNKIKDPFPNQKEIFFLRWWKGLYNLFKVNTWAILALILFLIPISILFLKKINYSINVSKKITNMLFIFSGFCLFFMLVKEFNNTLHYKGIIIKDTAFRKSYFDKNSQILTEGIEVEYAGIGKTGINIILPNGQEGIIDGNDFKKL